MHIRMSRYGTIAVIINKLLILIIIFYNAQIIPLKFQLILKRFKFLNKYTNVRCIYPCDESSVNNV